MSIILIGIIFMVNLTTERDTLHFSKAVAILSKAIDFKPDIIHTNDWHTALINLYKRLQNRDSYYNDIKTVFTIHNIKYQGVYDA